MRRRDGSSLVTGLGGPDGQGSVSLKVQIMAGSGMRWAWDGFEWVE